MLFTASKTLKTFCVTLLFGMLLACEQLPVKWNPQDYTVKRGDTLYSIAWRYEKDFRDIATWNNISAPYAIYPGQRLRMSPDGTDGTSERIEEPVAIETATTTVEVTETPTLVITPEPARPQRPEQYIVQKGDTLYSISRQYDVPLAHLARWNALHKTHQIRPGQILRLTPPGIARVQPAPTTQPRSSSPVAAIPETVQITQVAPVKTVELPPKVEQWLWPVKGPIVKTFSASDTARKGIGIGGNRGQPVVAAASGKVVYSGNGLISYGNLVIIKHSNSFLSAYAYNRNLLVSEGDFVQAGQEIAQMGVGDNNRAQLHFEIRKDGKPVDPLRYLPRG
ncbi:MAG: LysM peptidoglycan-binding domain-containing protein [Gammaproteobacteria bacterium]|nr:MAG: LysM peptidoglycan-binding domain-containing protein [Gammaproteobacteria bacterium]